MRLDLFVKLKYESSTITSFVGILSVTYFLTSIITMPEPKTSDASDMVNGVSS